MDYKSFVDLSVVYAHQLCNNNDLCFQLVGVEVNKMAISHDCSVDDGLQFCTKQCMGVTVTTTHTVFARSDAAATIYFTA